MTTQREVVGALSNAAAGSKSVVLATVVRVTGSSYGGVGARMVIRTDGSTVGLVSGGCLESDLAEHARRVHTNGRPEVVSYDTRDDDDAPWGLGLGCNGLIEVLLEPLPPSEARDVAAIIDQALAGDSPSVIATVIRAPDSKTGLPAIGAHALLGGAEIQSIGEWGSGSGLADAAQYVAEALAAGRRGLVREIGAVEVAFEVVMPAVRLIVCGTGPDAAPVARFASQLGWDVTVVDHRPLTNAHSSRFPGARVVECAEALRLADVVMLTPRSAAVVMSHHLTRDRDYMHALLGANVAYLGVLGPRARTERMLSELTTSKGTVSEMGERFFAPVGMDIGGEGPDAIALSIISQISAVTSGRAGGHLRDRRAPLHASPSPVAAVGSI
ncbi:MAG TPA: XdhC family protein [Gemmatimonadaceae bacterium]|nr:XdhC family protein [Gemmatimonadaceae bacterium]